MDNAAVTPLPAIDNPDHVQAKQAATRWQRFVTTVWDSDYYVKSPQERRLVHKLDCMILTVVCFGWLMKYLDQANLANAYVSGMKEDLKILGNEYTFMGTLYNVAYALLQVPSNLIVLKVRPSLWLGGCEVAWMIFTFAQAGARHSQDMYAFRFFVGLFEAAFQPVSLFLLASWYTKRELAKRTAFWMCSGIFGSAISGYLQAAIYATMDGVAGVAGWRWLYIVCGLMTLPSALLTLFLLPDFPHNSRSRFLSQDEIALAIARKEAEGYSPVTGKIGFSLIKRVLFNWRLYVISIVYLIYATSVQDVNYEAIWLRAHGLSVVDANVWFAATKCIAIPCFLFYGWLTDKVGSRFWVCFVVMCWAMIPTGIIAVHPLNNWNLMVFAWFMTDTYVVTPILFPWFNEICKGDAEARAVIIAAANLLFYIFNSFLPVIIFPQTTAPRFFLGFWATFGFVAASPISFVVLKLLHDRQLRQEAADEKPRDAEQVMEGNDYKEKDGDVVDSVRPAELVR